MSDLAPAVPGSISERVINAIVRGEIRLCTYSYDRGINCLGKNVVAWCTGCWSGQGAARCPKHIVHGKCATCNTPVVMFETIVQANAAKAFVGAIVHGEVE